MDRDTVDWRKWRRFFAGRSNRPLPRLDVNADFSHLPSSLARSLAIFQLGESGGGTVVEQCRCSTLGGVDQHYAEAMALFVDEEHRHANILAICVRMLGGSLIRKNWTARFFVATRRLIGLRFKVMVLLAAEVVGLCYYHLLAAQLPRCQIREMLSELVEDERSHLFFHCDFLRSQTGSPLRRRVFVLAWRATMLAAAIAVIVDHRAAIRDMDIGVNTIWRRWMSYCRLAEQLVTGRSVQRHRFTEYRSYGRISARPGG